MNNEHISDALQFLDDDLLLHTQALRNRKPGGIPMKKRLTVLIAAVLVMTLCCATAFAAVNGGWFSDVKRLDGAVIGTEYHNATEEIAVTPEAAADTITVTVTFLTPEEFPYRELQLLRIGSCTIADKEFSTEAAAITDGSVRLTIPIGDLPAGDYTLHITEFVGEKKGDQPLPIYGTWDCSFTVE